MEYTEDEIWNEIDRIVAEDKEGKFTPGQNIYYNIPHFCNAEFFFDPEFHYYIQAYFYATKFNVPIAKDLDSGDAFTFDIFRIIYEETMSCEKRQSEMSKNG